MTRVGVLSTNRGPSPSSSATGRTIGPGAVPGADFLEACPLGVRANLVAILKAVAEAPPPRFAGGLQWAGHTRRNGGFLRGAGDGPGEAALSVFCILEREAEGLPGPSLIVITGLDKPNEAAFSRADYRRVRKLGDEYRTRSPRSIER